MTGLDLVAVQDAILDHIRTELPQYDIREDEVLDDEYLLKINNNTKPFIVLRWHGLNRLSSGGSFGGVLWDQYSSSVDIVAVAPTPKIARKLLNGCMNTFIGWVVPGGGQLTPIGGQSVVPVIDNNAKPYIYLAVNTLSFQVDSNGIAP